LARRARQAFTFVRRRPAACRAAATTRLLRRRARNVRVKDVYLSTTGLLGRILVAALVHEPVQCGLVHVRADQRRRVDENDATVGRARLGHAENFVGLAHHDVHNLANDRLIADDRRTDIRRGTLLHLFDRGYLHGLHLLVAPDGHVQLFFGHVPRHILVDHLVAVLALLAVLVDHGRVLAEVTTPNSVAAVLSPSALVGGHLVDVAVHPLARALGRARAHALTGDAARGGRVGRRHCE